MRRTLLLILVLLPVVSFASHYMGGEITWQCITSGPNAGKFRFVMKLYRECNGITYSATETIQVTNCQSLSNITMTLYPGGNPHDIDDGLLDGKTDLSPECWDPSISIHCDPLPAYANTGAIQEWYYTSDAAYPNGVQITGVPPAAGWIFSHTSCCRNPCINLQNPTGQNWFLRAVMYPNNGMNTYPCYDNSPVFAETSAPVFVAGVATHFNYNAFDPDLDSIGYEWAPALQALSQSISYTWGYTYDHPIQTSSLDPFSGEITINSASGAFVVVTKATSFRDGIKIAEVFREMQVVLITSPTVNNAPEVSAPFYNPNSGLYDLFIDTVQAGDVIDFDIIAIDVDTLPNGDPNTITLESTGQYYGSGFTNPAAGCPHPPCATLLPAPPISTMVALTTHFHWETSCDQMIVNPVPVNGVLYNSYHFVFRIFDNVCPVPSLDFFTVTIVVKYGDIIDHPEIQCIETDSSGNVLLTWVPPLDTGNDFNSYVIYRSTAFGGPYLPIDTLFNISQSTYLDPLINPNWNALYYCIKSQSGCLGFIEPPDSASVMSTLGLQMNIPVADPLVLQWSHINSTFPVNPWYFVYMKCPSQSWTFIDSTQMMSYTLPLSSDQYEGCSFRVLYHDSLGCNGYSDVFVFDPANVQESSLSEQSCFELFPNPGKEEIYIQGHFEIEDPNAEIVDVLGSVHWINLQHGSHDEMLRGDISGFPPGIYFLRINGCDQVEKLIILE